MTIKPYRLGLYVATQGKIAVVAPCRLEAMKELAKLILGV